MPGIKRRNMLARTLSTVCALGAAHQMPAIAVVDESARVRLPPPVTAPQHPLYEALLRRRSVRSYSPRPVALAAVSQLLWAAQGVTGTTGGRTAPSAGALYPLELHLVTARAEGLVAGVYRYIAGSHQLRLVAAEAVVPALARAALSQQSVADSAAVIVIAAVEERTARKYGARASRYVIFEAGAASQNLALQAAAQGLGTVVVGAFDDSAVARVLRLPPGEQPIVLMPIGAQS